MDVYDSAAVQAVWGRVMQQRPLTEDILAEWIAAELASQRTYRSMARRDRRFAARFMHMANDEAMHARKLRGLYYLLFGHYPKVRAGAADTERSFGAALRTSYRGELAARDNYHAAAEKWQEHAQLFRAIADDENRHAQMIQKITSDYI